MGTTVIEVDRPAAPIRHHDGLPRAPPPWARPATTVVTTTMAQCTACRERGARRHVVLVWFHARTWRQAGSAAGRGVLRGVCGDALRTAECVVPAAKEGARVGLPPTAGACEEVSPTGVREGRRRRPGSACERAVDRVPRWGNTLCVFPRCGLSVQSCCELLCFVVSRTLSAPFRLHSRSRCAGPWGWCGLRHLVVATSLPTVCPWAGV